MRNVFLIALIASSVAVHVHAAAHTVAVGKIQVHYDEDLPLELRVGVKDVAVTGANAKYIHQEYTDVNLVGEDGATVSALLEGVTEASAHSGEHGPFIYAGLTFSVGTELQGAEITTAHQVFTEDASASSYDFGTDGELCLTEIPEEGEAGEDGCGEPREYHEGQYKFTILAKTTGSAFGIPDGAEYFRLTMKLTAVNMGGVDIYFNQDVEQVTIPEGQITHITFYSQAADKSLTYRLQQYYNRDNQVTGDMRIVGERVEDGEDGESERAMYLHYDLPLTDIEEAGQFMLYDPDVTVTDGQDDGTDGTGDDDDSASDSGASSTAASAALALAAAAAAVMVARH